MKRRIFQVTMIVLATMLASACAADRDATAYRKPARIFARTQEQEQASRQFEVYDPIEGTNRRLYKFNAQFDRYVFLPVVDAYKFVVPQYVDDRFSDFFSNVGEFRNATNSVLQAKPGAAGTAVGRFAINTTFGVLGFFDTATSIGLKAHKEDFGQTLGVWGVGPGPYLIVPILGPGNVRDTVGLAVDSLAFSALVPNRIEDSTDYMVVAYGLRPINTRANTDFRYYETGSPFEYELVRYVTTEARRLEIQQ